MLVTSAIQRRRPANRSSRRDTCLPRGFDCLSGDHETPERPLDMADFHPRYAVQMYDLPRRNLHHVQ